jgi:hypothetical protein
MNWYKTAKENDILLFRGDESPLDIENFNNEHAIKTLGKELGSSMANGPGIYFTVSEKNAGFYGSNITRRTLETSNILTESSPKLNRRQIGEILQGVDQSRMEIAVSNWHENHWIGKNELIKNIMNADTAIEQLMLIWSDVFFHQDPYGFTQLMTDNGIDGISVVIENASDPNDNDIHYIIYNKNVLK